MKLEYEYFLFFPGDFVGHLVFLLIFLILLMLATLTLCRRSFFLFVFQQAHIKLYFAFPHRNVNLSFNNLSLSRCYEFVRICWHSTSLHCLKATHESCESYMTVFFKWRENDWRWVDCASPHRTVVWGTHL